MELKSTVTDLDEVAEPFREAYVQEGDEYVLQTDQKDRIKEFRTNNINLMKRLDKLEAGLTVEKPPKKEKPVKDDDTPAVPDAVQRQLDELQAKLQQADERIHRAEVYEKLLVVAGKHGVRPEELEEQAEKAAQFFVNESGRLIRMEGDERVFSEKKPSQPMGPDEYFEQLAQEKRYLFKESVGGDAPGGGRAGGTPAGVKVIPNDPKAIGNASLEDMKSGKIQFDLDW